MNNIDRMVTEVIERASKTNDMLIAEMLASEQTKLTRLRNLCANIRQRTRLSQLESNLIDHIEEILNVD
jgi:hypothetical protein